MKAIRYLVGWFFGQLALIAAKTKSPIFWLFAIQCWKRSRIVSQTVTGPYPVRSLPLRLVDIGISIPDAEKRFCEALSRPSVTVAAYCLIALKMLGKLDSKAVESIVANTDDSICVGTGCFAVNVSLKNYATKLMSE